MSMIQERPAEVVRNEFARTHPEMSEAQEHDERLNGTIDKSGRRLPAYLLELGIIIIGLFLAGFYMMVIHPVW